MNLLSQDKFIMSEPVSYNYFKPLCDKMGGELPTPMNTAELKALHDEMASAYKMLGCD